MEFLNKALNDKKFSLKKNSKINSEKSNLFRFKTSNFLPDNKIHQKNQSLDFDRIKNDEVFKEKLVKFESEKIDLHYESLLKIKSKKENFEEKNDSELNNVNSKLLIYLISLKRLT